MSKPIRILQVIGKMDRGGAETMIMNLYRHIDKSKVQFDFVVHTNQKGAYDDEIIKLGGKIYHVPRFRGTNILSYYNAWNQFFIDHKEYKIIHGHIGSCASIYLKSAKKFGLFTIAHSHNTGTGEGLKGKMYSMFSYPTRYIADYFFACSKAAGLARYGKHVVTSSDRFSILKNAINLENFAYSESVRHKKRSEFNLENKLVLGHVGRFNTQKNHIYIIDIFKAVHDRNKDTMLILIGDGDLMTQIKDKVDAMGLSNNVIFTGVREDIPELLQAIDIFVFPSFYEGLPVTVIEAQAAGLPCLISDTITQEVKITQLVNMLSIEATPDSWANHILMYTKTMRENMSEYICNNGYDIKTTTDWLENFYIEFIKRKNK